MIVNLTPHKLVICTTNGDTLSLPKPEPDVSIPRVYMREDMSADGDIRAINDSAQHDYIERIVSTPIKIENIPPKLPGVIYVVSRVVFDHISCIRDDFATPGRILKDIDRKPMSCQCLIVAE